jgi:2-polyprenyl-3-methyl-5-hydroxy-6-metoxy-1,4-benzoquinol methylase
MSVERRVQEHFEADATRFDAIYRSDQGLVAQLVDNVWRGVVRRRFELTLDILEPLSDKTVLDVGCGSGRYCIAFAERGARRVVGVDMAPAMIDLAIEHARRAAVVDRCEFRVGSFPSVIPVDERFDACTAMGFFDYIDRPVPILSSMRELTRSTIVMSFPKSQEWRAPLRRIRFRFLRCPLFLYSEAEVRGILADAGLTRFEWIPLDRDYIVVAHP